MGYLIVSRKVLSLWNEISSIPNGFECHQCGSIRFWKMNKGRYECSDCHKETTVTTNTMFHKTTKPLIIWFHALW